MSGYDSSLMTADERLEEAAEILATGILRLRQKKRAKKTSERETICLDSQVESRLHVTVKQPGNGETT
ncbi:MAG: hypothetical protein HQL72_03665 [Magnetococcales bacterium]|nr:hypothetical protein [Magnetococcales bacterium]